VNEREAARSKGISTGRYVLYNKYKDLENDLSLEDAKDADVNVLIKVCWMWHQKKEIRKNHQK